MAELIIMYIEDKFPNLMEVGLIHGDDNSSLWTPLSDSDLNTVLHFLFSISRFLFRALFNMEMRFVKQFYAAYYCRYYSKVKNAEIVTLKTGTVRPGSTEIRNLRCRDICGIYDIKTFYFV
jgi:hypothetical protein